MEKAFDFLEHFERFVRPEKVDPHASTEIKKNEKCHRAAPRDLVVVDKCLDRDKGIFESPQVPDCDPLPAERQSTQQYVVEEKNNCKTRRQFEDMIKEFRGTGFRTVPLLQ